MRPLLWKEMRDLRWWLAGGAVFVGLTEWLFRMERYRWSFEGGYLVGFMPMLLAITAIGLGAGQIARERHNRTLDYLLVRPVSPTVIVWAKFLAGTFTLVLLVSGVVAVGFLHPPLRNSSVQLIREQVGYRQMLATLLPRYWCAYALTLLVSVILDRSAKVAGVMTAVAITVAALAMSFTELAPFSGFGKWLPFIDMSGSLINAARNPSMLWGTGAVFGGAAIALAGCGAWFLARKRERTVGNPGLLAMVAGIAGAALLSAHGAAGRFPSLLPLGSFQLKGDGGLVADGDQAALVQGDGVRFVSFADPARPQANGTVALPLWSAFASRTAIAADTVFAVGQKKNVPLDETTLEIVRPDGVAGELSLGPVRPHELISAPVPNGRYLYLGVSRGLQCSLHVFDLASRQEVAALPIDTVGAPRSDEQDWTPPMTMCRRGEYLYVGSPASLTTVDLRNPALPVVVSRVAYHPKATVTYGITRPLVWQGGRLFEITFWPWGLGQYDLSDPGHPKAQHELIWNEGFDIAGSGGALYKSWEAGVLEFRVEGDDLRGQRYLQCGSRVSELAIAGRRLFALTASDETSHRKLLAFDIGR